MNCGIVILNYNTFDLTCNLVKSILNYKEIDKIVIVDNNSKDNFNEFCNKENNDKIKYIKNNFNSGYAAGNNVGLKYLKDIGCKYAFIANPDVIMSEETINKILNFLMNNTQYAIASSVRTQNGTNNTAQYWWIPNFKDSLFESIYIGRKLQGNKSKRISNNVIKDTSKKVIDVEVVGGAFFGCNLEILEKLDFLDENTFLWYEENILAFKLRENNYKEALLCNCLYEHNHLKKGRGNSKYKIFASSKYYYCEHYLKINQIQKCILKIFDTIGFLENKLICIINKMIK